MQCKPEVVTTRVGKVTFLREPAQAGDAVELAVDVTLLPRCTGREDQVTLLYHHQEEQAVNQPQKLLVVVVGFEVAVDDGCTQDIVVGVRKETIAEIENRLFDYFTQPVADAGARIEGVLMVALNEALCCSIVGPRQAGSVE